LSCPVISKNEWAKDKHVTGAAEWFRARLSRLIRLATLVVKGTKVAATLPSGKVGQTVLKKKKECRHKFRKYFTLCTCTWLITTRMKKKEVHKNKTFLDSMMSITRNV